MRAALGPVNAKLLTGPARQTVSFTGHVRQVLEANPGVASDARQIEAPKVSLDRFPAMEVWLLASVLQRPGSSCHGAQTKPLVRPNMM